MSERAASPTNIDALLAEAQTWPRLVEGPRPCAVIIDHQIWPAVWYKQEVDTLAGSAAWLRGERTHVREGLYCLGQLPALYKHGRAAFPYKGRDWYVASYRPKSAERGMVRQMQADVENFILIPRDAPGSIDQYKAPHRRAPLTIRWHALPHLPGPHSETAAQKRHRIASARPHGLCERAGRCVEHEQDSRVEACLPGVS